MTRLVLDKNHKTNDGKNFSQIMEIFEENNLFTVTYRDPFFKVPFFEYFFSKFKKPVIVIDFDLLYSGLLTSEIISLPENITIIKPTKENWNTTFKQLLLEISEKEIIIVLDSLNSISSMFYETYNVGRWINNTIMLLGSFAQKSNSKIIITGMVKPKEGKGFVLSNSGRQFLDIPKMIQVNLQVKNFSLILTQNNSKNSEKKSFSIPIKLTLS